MVHEPARLAILAVLSAVENADFVFLLRQTGLTKGNLSSHAAKLEDAGYIEVEKTFVDRVPRTLYRLTDAGGRALAEYETTMRDVLAGLDAH
jgi:DNA-binding MarR family transcriptional regulator